MFHTRESLPSLVVLRRCGAYLVEVQSAVLGSLLAGVAIKDGKVTLSSQSRKVVDERVGTAHRRSKSMSDVSIRWVRSRNNDGTTHSSSTRRHCSFGSLLTPMRHGVVAEASGCWFKRCKRR